MEAHLEFDRCRDKLIVYNEAMPWEFRDFCALDVNEVTNVFVDSNLNMQERGKFRRLHNAGKGIICHLFMSRISANLCPMSHLTRLPLDLFFQN